MASRVIPVDPFDLVIFGGTGDLARRKILPALFRRFVAGQFGADTRLTGAARGDMETADYRAFVQDALSEFAPEAAADTDARDAFLDMLAYVALDAEGCEGWEALAARMRGVSRPREYARASGMTAAPRRAMRRRGRPRCVSTSP